MKTIHQIDATRHISLIEHGSLQYEEAVKLRFQVLRKPLGLEFTQEQLLAEKQYYHIAYFEDGLLKAYLMLVPETDGKIKMKQVAVAFDEQGKGIGRELVFASEQFAKQKGFSLMYCHARDTAVPFYKKSGYKVVGDMFTEVTIPHYAMEKLLF